MWRWLDRERELYNARLGLKEERRLKRSYFALWRKVCAEVETLRVERAQALDEVKDLGRRLDAAKAAHQTTRTEHFAEVKRIQDEKQLWERAAEQAIIPPPSTRLNPDDRAGMYRLEAENERLRAQLAATVHDLAELRTKYEGNPS